MARVVQFHEIGGPEVLKIEQVDVPPPGKGEVQISIKALGLNRAEVMIRTGIHISQPRFPARNGYEAAVTVAAIGVSPYWTDTANVVTKLLPHPGDRTSSE